MVDSGIDGYARASLSLGGEDEEDEDEDAENSAEKEGDGISLLQADRAHWACHRGRVVRRLYASIAVISSCERHMDVGGVADWFESRK